MKVGAKALACFVAVLFLFSSPLQANAYNGFGTKQTETKEEIASGVSLRKERYKNGSVERAIHVLDIFYRHPSIDLELYHLTPLGTVKPASQHAAANTYDGHYVVGAMNASFFNMANGFPVNLIVKNNEIIHFGRLGPDANSPVHAPFAFGVNRNGALMIAEFQPTLKMIHNGRELELHSVNGERQYREAVLYTSAYAKPTTGASPYVTDIVVTNTDKSAKNFSFGDRITGTVSEIRRLGEGADAPIPEDGFVISANGAPLAEALASVSVGDEITVEAQINDVWKDAKFLLATGPTLVRNGNVSISMNEKSSFASTRRARSAVGISSDGTKLYFVTIDEGNGYSAGATLRELAEYMRSLGAYHAINLDGGGSTTLLARLPYYERAVVVNRPSDGRERSVPTTLQVISTEPPKKVTEAMLVVDSFETLDRWVAASSRAQATLQMTTAYDPVRVGTKAFKLTYDYTKGETGTAAAYVQAKTAIPLKGRPLELGMWAYGDERPHWLRATVIDGAGARHTVDFTESDAFHWTGWRYVRAKLPTDAPLPLSVERVYIAQPDVTKQGKGTVYFDQLEAIYQSSYQVDRFKDVPANHWAHDAILRLNDRDVIKGYRDGRFGPSDPITREQTALMIARALDLKASDHQPTFRDVPKTSYYYEAIAAVDRAGIMNGKRAQSFAPKDTLTRAEMAAILQRAYQLRGTSSSPFPDVPPNHWAFEAIDALKANGIAKGMPNGGFGPAEPTTRAEFSVFLDRVSR